MSRKLLYRFYEGAVMVTWSKIIVQDDGTITIIPPQTRHTIPPILREVWVKDEPQLPL